MRLWKKNDNFGDYADYVFDIVRNNMLRAVDNFVDAKFPAIKSGFMAWRPHIDLKENEKEYTLYVDIPGVNKDDISIKLRKHNDENTLVIEGERKIEEKKDTDTHHRVERFQGKFMRSFSIPDNVIVDQNEIDAKLENGVLTIVLKKRPACVNSKKSQEHVIEIKSKTKQSK